MSAPSVYAVAAKTATDIAAAVDFAREHNLRLVVDRLITLTSPTGWTALLAIVALLSAIVAWAIFGSVPTRVNGAGILVSKGGQVFDAMAPAAGSLASVAAIGTKVQKGDVVATLDDTQAGQDLDHAKKVLHEQEEQLSQLAARFDREIEARRRVDAQQRANLTEIIAASEQRHTFYAEELKSDAPISAKGYLTRRYMQETRQQNGRGRAGRTARA
jgi:HlyD family secretion protein